MLKFIVRSYCIFVLVAEDSYSIFLLDCSNLGKRLLRRARAAKLRWTQSAGWSNTLHRTSRGQPLLENNNRCLVLGESNESVHIYFVNDVAIVLVHGNVETQIICRTLVCVDQSDKNER